MSRVFDRDVSTAVSHLFNLPGSIDKFICPSQANENHDSKGISGIPVDVLDTPEEYILYMDVPGLSKMDIQIHMLAALEIVKVSNSEKLTEGMSEVWMPMTGNCVISAYGLSSERQLQVTIEDENTLVIRSGGKRKREDGEDEGCKYLRLERRTPQKITRKFRLPDNANVSAVTAKCENGVLIVVVEKLPPPPKPKTVGSFHHL